jgi:hypothetical protein
VNAIYRTRIVAVMLGEDKIKKDLIPYYDKLIDVEDDEVCFALAF